MNISFSETFKKVTSVALIFGLVFSTLTPAAFAAVSINNGNFSNVSGMTNAWGGWYHGTPPSWSISGTGNYVVHNGVLNLAHSPAVQSIGTVAVWGELITASFDYGDRWNGGYYAANQDMITVQLWDTTINTLLASKTVKNTWAYGTMVSSSISNATAATVGNMVEIRFISLVGTGVTPGNAAALDNIIISVADGVWPVLALPSNISQEATSPGGNVVTFTATSTDVDPASPTVTCTPASGTTFPITATTVNCSATDTAGNVSNGSFTVTVQDTTKPVITLNGGTVNLNVGDTYTEQGATATDLVDGDITASVVTSGSVNTAAPGVYTISYNVTDSHSNVATTVSRTVNVSDVTAPVISGVPSDIVVEQVGNAAATVSYTNPTANDDVDGSISVLCSPSSGSSFSYGLTAVLCNATDLSSNVANASFNVTVQDTGAPTAASVSIISDNTTPTLAKEGDTITVSFTTSEPVNTPTATIGGKTATVTNVSGNDYTATYTLTAAETQGVVSLTIDFADIAGNNATQVTATVDSSSVTIDTVTPTPFTIIRPSDNEVIEVATSNSEGTCETGTTIAISGAALQTNPTITTCVGGQFLTPITFTSGSLNTTFNLTFTQTDTAGNTNIKSINNIQYRTPVVTGGGSGPANTDFVNTNNSNPPAPTTPTPTPAPTLTPTQPTTTETTPIPEPTPETTTPEVAPTPTTSTDETTPKNTETPVNNTPSAESAPTSTTPTQPTAPATGGSTGRTPAPAFNPADATLDQGGGITPEDTETVVEAPTPETTTDVGGWVAVEESSYTLLWTLLGLIALLNTWWFFVAKNKPTFMRRD